MVREDGIGIDGVEVDNAIEKGAVAASKEV
jgi:hypothetical protein